MTINIMGFSFKPPDGVVIDIGAHRGLFAEPLLRMGYTVWAYEPNPSEYQRLAALSKSFNNFRCHRAAVGGIHIKEVTFTDYGNDGHSSSAYTRVGRLYSKKGTFTAPQFSVDEVISKHPKVGLLKMNVEGAEMEILSHGSMSMFNRCKQIAVAFHAGQHKGMGISLTQVEELVHKFHTAGFEPVKLSKKGPYYLLENKNGEK